MARRHPVGIRLITRRGNDWSDRFPLVIEAVNHLKVRSCLIDGEVVCCDDRGLAQFDVLRRRRNEVGAFLYAFDLLELDGTDLRREPIETRKATLASILRKAKHGVRLNEHLEHDCGLTVFQHACQLGCVCHPSHHRSYPLFICSSSKTAGSSPRAVSAAVPPIAKRVTASSIPGNRSVTRSTCGFEREERAASRFSERAKCLFRRNQAALLKQEQLSPNRAQLLGGRQCPLKIAAELVADDRHGLHRALPRLLQRVLKNVGDLDETTADAARPCLVQERSANSSASVAQRVVMNGTNIANELVAHSEPDGHTVLMGGSSQAATRGLYPSLSYDPIGYFM